MRLRSGYVKTEDVEDWKYCFNESDSESDGLDEPADEQTDRKPKIEPDTLDSFLQVDHQTRGAYDDEQRPWVPAQLPSCVPRSSPMPTQKPSKHRSGAQHRSGDAQQLLHPRVYQLGGPQQACAGHDRIAGPQPRGNNITNTFPGYVTMGAGLDLPWMTPAAKSCYSFGFQVPVPMAPAYPNFAMDAIPHPLPGEPAANAGPDNADGIPLKCCLCPKKPNFSDVSHLLTHISSKSHLAARFRLEISDKDEDKYIIQLFQEWADRYGITQLLKNRQDAKEQKKQTQQKRQRPTGTEETNTPLQKKPRRSAVAQHHVKVEDDNSLQIEIAHNPLNRHAWHLYASRDDSLDDAFQTPANKRPRSVYPFPDSPQALAYLNNEPVPLGSDEGSNTPKLKGAVWPGMRIFDAATPEMKRMRNQKKHHSVLKNMVTTSESIEQTEYVWTEGMVAIERTRNVYDSPSVDGSPDPKESKDEEEVLPVKKRRARRAASTVPNAPRQTRSTTRVSKAGKRGAAKKAPKIEEESDSGGEFNSSHGIRGLDEFDGVDDASVGGDVFGGRRQVVQDFGGNPFGGQQVTLPYRPAMHDLPTNRSMASMYGRQDNQPSFAFFDKENDHNTFSLQQASSLPAYLGQQRQNMQSGGLNPLCVQRQDNFPFLYGGFDNSRPSNQTFQSVGVVEYSGLNNGSPYQPVDNSGHNNDDFGV